MFTPPLTCSNQNPDEGRADMYRASKFAGASIQQGTRLPNISNTSGWNSPPVDPKFKAVYFTPEGQRIVTHSNPPDVYADRANRFTIMNDIDAEANSDASLQRFTNFSYTATPPTRN